MWHNKAWLSQVEEKNIGDAEQQTCQVFKSQAYIDSSCSVDCIKCSLIIPVSRQRQSDGYKDGSHAIAINNQKKKTRQLSSKVASRVQKNHLSDLNLSLTFFLLNF